MVSKRKDLIPAIFSYCESLETQFDQIPPLRKTELLKLRDYISKKYHHKETPQAIIICTHNSRRSHMGQIWLSIGADYFDLPTILTYSGGTEATAFNPRAVAAIQKVGIQVNIAREDSSNPLYHLTWSENQVPYSAFSKKYDTPPNPTTDFAAIMVCTSADEGCPIVSGCDFRLALPFEDPKAFDDTNLESQKYDERCEQIGREMLFVMKNIDNGLQS